MSKVISAAFVAAAMAERYPSPGGALAGNIGAIEAEGGKAKSIEAANVLGFQQPTGKLVYIRATEHFFVGAGQIVQAGDFVQVKEEDARRIIQSGRAEAATDADVAAAQAADEVAPKGKK